MPRRSRGPSAARWRRPCREGRAVGEMQRVSAPRSTLLRAARQRSEAAPVRSRTDVGVRHVGRAPAAPLQAALAGRALQAKLAVGAANDPFEQEADRSADAVMSADSAPRASLGIGAGGIAASLMRVVRRALGKADPPTQKN